MANNEELNMLLRKGCRLRPIDDITHDLRRCLNGDCEGCPGNGEHDEDGECQWPINLVVNAYKVIIGEDSKLADAYIVAQKDALRRIADIATRHSYYSVFTGREYSDWSEGTPEQYVNLIGDLVADFCEIAKEANNFLEDLL